MIIVEPASSGRRRIHKAVLTTFLVQAQAAIGLQGEVNVLLAGNPTLQRLNLDFRKKNKPTDVLSFPALEVRSLRAEARQKGGIWIGDLAISVEIAKENAQRFGHALEMELKVLLLHGLLHLAGYDHETDNGRMARRERFLQKKLGLSAALIERTADKTESARPGLRPRKKEPREHRRGRRLSHGRPLIKASLAQAMENPALLVQAAAN